MTFSPGLLDWPYHARYELLEFAVFTLAYRGAGLIPIHAACVGRAGRGLLLVGASGTGKSTLATLSALRGLEFLTEDAAFVRPRDLLATGATVVASIWGRSVDDFAQAADMLAAAPAGVVAVEVNLSCPNREGRGSIFAHDAVLSGEVMAATAGCGRPRWAKLSANTDRIIQVAEAVIGAGDEAVTCINTLLGLAYDPETLSPTLGAGGGGLSVRQRTKARS